MKQKLKNIKKKYWMILSVILLILIAIIAFLLLRNEEENTEEDANLGFGDSDEPIDLPEVPDEFEVGVYSIQSPSKEKEFKLRYSNKAINNEIFIEGTEFKEKGVVNAKWSSDENYIIFSKTEEVDSEESNTTNSGNLWRVNSDGSNLIQIFELEEPTTIDFVSNGSIIAFSTDSRIGKMNIDGTNVSYIYEYTNTGSNGDSEEIPTLEQVDENNFKVTLVDENKTELKFSY